MALPIKDTPTLRGRDAKRFIKKMEENNRKYLKKQKNVIRKDNYESV